MAGIRQALRDFLRSATMISMTGGVVATGGYVTYKDYTRYRRMVDVYCSGNILPPLAENQYEICYFPRPDIEQQLRHAFASKFANEYYLVNGEVGSGKTRMIIETVRDMIKTDGAQNLGAPIYVLVTQGKSFPETLATALHFYFDEHISYKFFLDAVMRIHSFPQKDDDSRLTRVLDAIEESSFIYMQQYGRPVVIIIDGANSLPTLMPGALERIQDKAKLWADTNTVKIVFVNNDEATEDILQKNTSSWSRSANPIDIPDLSREDAIRFLMADRFLETPNLDTKNSGMSLEEATEVVNLVGGRIVHLVAFKRDFCFAIPFLVTAESLKDREREKFIHVARKPAFWSIVSALRSAPNKTYKLSKMIKLSSADDVHNLALHNVIRYDRDKVGYVVKFQSPLTEVVVDEMQHHYMRDKHADAIADAAVEAAVADAQACH